MPYLEVGELVEQPAEIIRRTETIGPDASEETTTAALGLAKPDPILFSKLPEMAQTLAEYENRKKDQHQLYKWVKQRERAARHFVEVCGDMPLEAVTRKHALLFRDWWRKRIEAEGLTANSANKDLTIIQGMWRLVNTREMLGLDEVWAKLSFKEEKKKTARPSFST